MNGARRFAICVGRGWTQSGRDSRQASSCRPCCYGRGRRYTGRSAWTAAHQRYLAMLAFEHSAHDIAFTDYRQALGECDTRVRRLGDTLAHEVEFPWELDAEDGAADRSTASCVHVVAVSVP